MFYELHPFHIIMDDQLRLLQWGAAVGRCMPELQIGRHVRDFFRVRTGASNKKIAFHGACCFDEVVAHGFAYRSTQPPGGAQSRRGGGKGAGGCAARQHGVS
jgi:hypothetical protein